MDPREIAPKNIWQRDDQDTWSFFCMQCKSPRKVSGRPQPWTLSNVGRIALTTCMFTLVTYPLFGLKGVVAFVPFWMIFEIVHRMRFRARVSCPYCGFDPFLYMTNIKRARHEIDQYWRARFEEKGVPFPEKNPINSVKVEPPVEEPPAELEN